MFHRKSNRYGGWDYSTSAYYFVTICTFQRQTFFGHIQDEEMILNTIGEIAHKYWQEIPSHFPNVELDEFIIMPNHVHGIIFIKDCHSVGNRQCVHSKLYTKKDACPHSRQSTFSTVGTADLLSLQRSEMLFLERSKMLLSKVIHGYKSSITRYLNQSHPNLHFQWQRSFYDHIIRSEIQLANIRQYIVYNPHKWHRDLENPGFIKSLNKFQQQKIKKNYYKDIYA